MSHAGASSAGGSPEYPAGPPAPAAIGSRPPSRTRAPTCASSPPWSGGGRLLAGERALSVFTRLTRGSFPPPRSQRRAPGVRQRRRPPELSVERPARRGRSAPATSGRRAGRLPRTRLGGRAPAPGRGRGRSAVPPPHRSPGSPPPPAPRRTVGPGRDPVRAAAERRTTRPRRPSAAHPSPAVNLPFRARRAPDLAEQSRPGGSSSSGRRRFPRGRSESPGTPDGSGGRTPGPRRRLRPPRRRAPGERADPSRRAARPGAPRASPRTILRPRDSRSLSAGPLPRGDPPGRRPGSRAAPPVPLPEAPPEDAGPAADGGDAARPAKRLRFDVPIAPAPSMAGGWTEDGRPAAPTTLAPGQRSPAPEGRDGMDGGESPAARGGDLPPGMPGTGRRPPVGARWTRRSTRVPGQTGEGLPPAPAAAPPAGAAWQTPPPSALPTWRRSWRRSPARSSTSTAATTGRRALTHRPRGEGRARPHSRLRFRCRSDFADLTLNRIHRIVHSRGGRLGRGTASPGPRRRAAEPGAALGAAAGRGRSSAPRRTRARASSARSSSPASRWTSSPTSSSNVYVSKVALDRLEVVESAEDPEQLSYFPHGGRVRRAAAAGERAGGGERRHPGRGAGAPRHRRPPGRARPRSLPRRSPTRSLR